MMLMLKNAESLTTEFNWVQLIDAKLDTSGKFETTSEMNVEINNLESFKSCAAELICASDLLESKSVKSENSETTLTSDLTIDKSESVESLQSKFDWTFEIIYDRLEDSSHFRFLEKDEWHNALRLCHSSHFLLWTCNSLVVLHQHVSWDDSDLNESNAFYFQKLKNVYFILWATISFAFTRLYYQEWNRLSVFFSHDSRFLPDYDEHDRCVYQLIMNIERRLVFDDHVHVLLMIYFDRRQSIKLTLLRRVNERMHQKWVKHVELISSSSDFQLVDDHYDTQEQTFTRESISSSSEQEKQTWAFSIWSMNELLFRIAS